MLFRCEWLVSHLMGILWLSMNFRLSSMHHRNERTMNSHSHLLKIVPPWLYFQVVDLGSSDVLSTKPPAYDAALVRNGGTTSHQLPRILFTIHCFIVIHQYKHYLYINFLLVHGRIACDQFSRIIGKSFHFRWRPPRVRINGLSSKEINRSDRRQSLVF